MAVAVQTYNPQVNALDAAPRRVMPQAPNISNAQGLAAIGNAISSAGNVMVEKEKADAATKANNILTDLRVKTQSDFENAKSNAADGAENFTPNLLSQFDKDTGKVQGSVSDNPLVSGAVQKGIQQIRATLAEQSTAWEANQRVSYRISSIHDNTTKLSNVIKNDPTQIKAVGDQQMFAINNAGLPPNVRLQLARDMNEQFTQAATAGMIQKEPESVIDQITNPDHAGAVIKGLSPDQQDLAKQQAYTQISKNQANAIVDTFANKGPIAGGKAYAAISKLPLPDEVKNQIIKTAQAGLGDLQAQRRQQYSQQLIGLESRLTAGNPATGDRQLAWSLYSKSAISQEQLASNLGRMDALIMKNNDDAARIQAVATAYQNKTPLDPKTDAKDLNDFFLSAAHNMTPGSADWQNLAVDVSAKTGVIPSTAVDGARADLVSGSPEAAATAAHLVTRLQDASPRGADFGLDTKTKAMAWDIDQAVQAGTLDAQAVEMARANSMKADGDQKKLDDKWKRIKPEQSAATNLQGLLKDDPHFKYGFWNTVPDPPPGIQDEFNSLTREYYNYTGGDLDKARKLAANDLKSTWGMTNVNGSPELMKYAPETRVPGLTAEMIRDDIAKSVPPGTDASKVKLAPMLGAGGTEDTKGMSWQLMQPGKFGNYEPILNSKNEPMTYTLPDARQGYEALQEKLKAEAHAKGLQEQADAKKRDEVYKAAVGNYGL